MTIEEIKDESNEVGVQEGEAEAPQAEGLTNREALAKAIAENRDTKAEGADRKDPEPDTADKSAAPTKQEVKDAVAADPEPPSEFSASGKKAWKDKDITGIQKEYRRLSEERTKEISRAQTAERQAREESKPWKDIASKAAPYIAARGKEGVTPENAIMEALALVDALKGKAATDPEGAKADLKSLGIDLDAKPGAAAKPSAPENNTLQPIVDELLQDKRQRDFERVSQTFGHSIGQLAALKNRTGEPVFPDLQDASEAGIQLAREIGSLTRDRRFVEGVLRRFPDADHTVLVRQAYIFAGGRVSGEPVKVSPEANQKHIERSRRAAASTPGRVVERNGSSTLQGKLSNRAALERALAERREH